MAAVAAPPQSITISVRKAVSKLADRAYAAAKAGAATALGTAGMGSIAVGAGMVYLPAGFMVGGGLAIWLASLLPDSRRK